MSRSLHHAEGCCDTINILRASEPLSEHLMREEMHVDFGFRLPEVRDKIGHDGYLSQPVERSVFHSFHHSFVSQFHIQKATSASGLDV